MVKNYKSKNTNVERIDQVNIVSKYITSSFGRSDFSYLVPAKYKFPEYKNNEEILTVVLDYDKILIYFDTIPVVKEISTFFTISSKIEDISKIIREYSDMVYNLLKDIQKDSFISFIFNGVLGRSIVVGLIDVFLNQINCKGILLQPYALNLSIGLGTQHCIVIDEYNTHFDIYIIDDYVLHDCFTVKKSGYNFPVSVCLSDDYDYVEEYQKLRLTEDISYYGCNLCDFKNKDICKIEDHLKNNHFYQDVDSNMILKYLNGHEDVIKEIINRLRFLYFNYERLKRINLKILYRSNITFNMNDLIDQLKFLYNNVLPIVFDDNLVHKGSEIFRSLDFSNDCWITNKEWNMGRIRVLKDKILFNI